MMLGYYFVRTFDPVLFSQSGGGSFVRQVTANLLAMTVRVSVAFSFGSFLATLLYRKRPAGPASLLGLGSVSNRRQS